MILFQAEHGRLVSCDNTTLEARLKSFIGLCVQTPHRTYMSQVPGGSTRKVLGERAPGNDTVFSQTTVSSGGQQGPGSVASSTHDVSTASLASVGPYNDFAVSGAGS